MKATRAPSPTPHVHALDLRVLRFRTAPQREEPALLAHALLESGRYAEAVELSTTALARDPSDVDLRLVHGVALAARGRLEEAQVVFMETAHEEPDWAEPWRRLASVLLQRGRPEQALAVAERAIALEPDEPCARALRREASLAARARRFLARAGDEEPALLAQELLAAGRHADALEVTRAALVEEMDDVDLLVTHASAARAMGDLDAAASALELASFEAPDWPAVWRATAEIELDRGHLEHAMRAAERARELAASDEEVVALHVRVAREWAQREERGLASVIVSLDA